jgi:Tol biopolymer transport system component
LAATHGFSVFLTGQDNSGFVRLDEQRNIGELRSFAWSPDGQLAIAGITRGSGNLYLLNADGEELEPVLPDTELGYLVGVAWSHDGEQLITWEISNIKVLYIVSRDGTGVARRELPMQFFETPQFAPDDESILFFGADPSSSGLFQVTLDSLQVHKISALVENESSFAWSPDGTRLAYMEMDRSLGEARLVAEGQDGKVVLGTLPIPQGVGASIPNSKFLSWSANGEVLVFEMGRNSADRSIYLAEADGTGLVKLVESAHAPTISANGKCLAYIRNKQVFLLDLAATSSSSEAAATPKLLADLPAGRGPANILLDELRWKPETTPVPKIR